MQAPRHAWQAARLLLDFSEKNVDARFVLVIQRIWPCHSSSLPVDLTNDLNWNNFAYLPGWQALGFFAVRSTYVNWHPVQNPVPFTQLQNMDRHGCYVKIPHLFLTHKAPRVSLKVTNARVTFRVQQRRSKMPKIPAAGWQCHTATDVRSALYYKCYQYT